MKKLLLAALMIVGISASAQNVVEIYEDGKLIRKEYYTTSKTKTIESKQTNVHARSIGRMSYSDLGLGISAGVAVAHVEINSRYVNGSNTGFGAFVNADYDLDLGEGLLASPNLTLLLGDGGTELYSGLSLGVNEFHFKSLYSLSYDYFMFGAGSNLEIDKNLYLTINAYYSGDQYQGLKSTAIIGLVGVRFKL